MLSDPLVLRENKRDAQRRIFTNLWTKFEIQNQNFGKSVYESNCELGKTKIFDDKKSTSWLIWIKSKHYSMVLYVNDNWWLFSSEQISIQSQATTFHLKC